MVKNIRKCFENNLAKSLDIPRENIAKIDDDPLINANKTSQAL